MCNSLVSNSFWGRVDSPSDVFNWYSLVTIVLAQLTLLANSANLNKESWRNSHFLVIRQFSTTKGVTNSHLAQTLIINSLLNTSIYRVTHNCLLSSAAMIVDDTWQVFTTSPLLTALSIPKYVQHSPTGPLRLRIQCRIQLIQLLSLIHIWRCRRRG